jgi:hypothetical protein
MFIALIHHCYRFSDGNVQEVRFKRGDKIMKALATLLLLGSLALAGCEFAAGAATGALATGAGYEFNAKRQMDRLEDDYRHERISRRDYERRKSQIESGSIIY